MTSALIKRVQSRFIQIDELCIENFSIYAMAVYQQLRLLSDFTKPCDEIKITIEALALKSKMSERKVYSALNELEHKHFVIQRLNYHHFRYGKINSYNVARDYNYFQTAQILNTPAQNDMGVQLSYTPARGAVTPAPRAVTPAQNDIPKEPELYSEPLSEKTTTDIKPGGGSFFSENNKEKLLINKLENDERTDKEFLLNCQHHVENNKDSSKGLYQKISMLIILLEKLYESGEKFKAHGFYKEKKQLVETPEQRWARYQQEKEDNIRKRG